MVSLVLNREHLLVWVDRVCSFLCLSLDSNWHSQYLVTRTFLIQLVFFWSLHRFSEWYSLVQQIGPCTVGNSSTLQHLFELAFATNLLHGHHEETLPVMSQVECAQALHGTNSSCEHTERFDRTVHHSVADAQEFELVRSSFRSTVVQIVSFLFGLRQMYTNSPNWNATCFQLRPRSSSRFCRCARVCRYMFAASVLIFKFCSIVMGLVLSVASAFQTGRLCANVH